MLHVYLCRTRLVHSLLDRMSGAVSIPNRMASVGECEALRKHDRVDLPFEVIPAYANGTKSKSTQETQEAHKHLLVFVTCHSIHVQRPLKVKTMSAAKRQRTTQTEADDQAKVNRVFERALYKRVTCRSNTHTPHTHLTLLLASFLILFLKTVCCPL